ncbi:MAG: type II toxin-antitoxin system prevent-host-death family antitoxin [Chloroflexota bacterium]|nr:type II toxin-antitoxin system prevent-host-death family antitoxin [Chloroflexota bacterium]
MEQVVGIRELKAGLSRYLRQVKAGGTVVITERGKPIGRIVPYAQSVEEQLEVLKEAGLVAWDGGKLEPIVPVAQVRGPRTMAELLLEDRE